MGSPDIFTPVTMQRELSVCPRTQLCGWLKCRISSQRKGVYRVDCSAVIGPGGPDPLEFPHSLAVGEQEKS